MTKKTIKRQSSISTVLRDIQSHSLLIGERRTMILNKTIVGQKIKDLDLSCADFINSKISDSTFYNCDLRGASFRESGIERTEFVNCSICDMELPDNVISITYRNCSSQPSGFQRFINLEDPRTVKNYPSTTYGKILSLVEITAKVAASLTIEKLLCIGIILAFITIIVVAVSLSK